MISQIHTLEQFYCTSHQIESLYYCQNAKCQVQPAHNAFSAIHYHKKSHSEKRSSIAPNEHHSLAAHFENPGPCTMISDHDMPIVIDEQANVRIQPGAPSLILSLSITSNQPKQISNHDSHCRSPHSLSTLPPTSTNPTHPASPP